jgi:uncharacterized membrane protein
VNENEIEKPVEGAVESTGEAIEDAVAQVDETVDAASQAAADAAAEAEASIESLASSGDDRLPEVAEATIDVEQPSAEPPESPKALPAPTAAPQGSGAHKPTITERLAEDTEFDPNATNDDRVMAALAYASQLINPIGLVLPIIILVSETSKQRPFQRYHAIQSLAVSAVLGLLQLGLTVLASAAGATVIGILCLCFIVPAMIMLWLLPLYYALVAYNGKRFKIPGLTQFLQDQKWL